MTIQALYNQITRMLVPLYGLREAAAVASRLLDELYGYTKLYRMLNPKEEPDKEVVEDILSKAGRLSSGVPAGYVTGNQEFLGRDFSVNPDVLIPRGETEEMVQLIVIENDRHPQLNILDIGTGSGVIAVSLALELPRAAVEAWDISEAALDTARKNAEALSANVRFRQQDVLKAGGQKAKWDIIVSNPPYVCVSEQEFMHRNVKDYEPSVALFVPDHDPLLFYKSIASLAAASLNDRGMLYLEINERFGREIEKLLAEYGFDQVRIIKDIHSRDRIAAAVLNKG